MKDRLIQVATGLAEEFEAAVAHAERLQAERAGQPQGMQVPFHGDFAQASQLPSFVGRARWWAQALRRAIADADTPPPLAIEPCRCGNAGAEEHTCPFASDVHGDNTTLCTCCPGCEQQCCDDI